MGQFVSIVDAELAAIAAADTEKAQKSNMEQDALRKAEINMEQDALRKAEINMKRDAIGIRVVL
jgi:hypothetical protein